ncbi:unnamed protein product [Periconia digitata]|uniref:Alpha-L-rhamnosidase six-hairpin glycosidase domain-containing protein n=1 Tax=Periconia digitata TaxID=1303443 RepID=A0A9W4UUH0_9PLEO|nr:unnamed protein product [Periconia digitata]
MAQGHQEDTSWMWHPTFTENRRDTAGLVVHFRRTFSVSSPGHLPTFLSIHITADTRYKLYVNRNLAFFGPVKGDSALWFDDAVDIAPYLHVGQNDIHVSVLRFFHGTDLATSFPRLPIGGLRVALATESCHWSKVLGSSSSWDTVIDPSITLRVDEPEDDFLHIYENVTVPVDDGWDWLPAKSYAFQISTGNSPPWSLAPRMIPNMRRSRGSFMAIHNVQSSVEASIWKKLLLPSTLDQKIEPTVLAPGSKHQIDLEMTYHTTAFIRYRFARPASSGGTLKIVYSEAYEEEPTLVPYMRRKANRRDSSRLLIGPSDIYSFQGASRKLSLRPWQQQEHEECFEPFHFRTFRFLRLIIEVGSSDLIFNGVDIETVTYPLDVTAEILSNKNDAQIWDTSIRTLQNCMHDCYEDCPFYEQLQYAMDARSSILFTYHVAGDDRLSRQAIIQLHNSFQSRVGLTSSRAPSNKSQIIPNFSLFWICMIADHYEYFGDVSFISHFLPVVDAVLNYFHARIGPNDLVKSDFIPGVWNFADWAKEWRPYGIPPLAEQTGISTYVNQLYTYTLRHAATIVSASGRSGLAQEYLQRANCIVAAIRCHCFDGEFFADSLVADADRTRDYSQLCQAWAILGGVVSGTAAQDLMRRTLATPAEGCRTLVRASTVMSFYVLRALSQAGGSLYDDHFHGFWAPWREQLALNMTTWEEDDVSQRSDCHAWACAPLYEFTAEVAGVRPAEPGWAAILFQPRLSLYPRFRARCPLRMSEGKVIGVACIEWHTNEQSDVKVTLRFDMKGSQIIPVVLRIPRQKERVVDTTSETVIWVKGSDGGCKSEESPSWNVVDSGIGVAAREAHSF